jgi:TolB-like protein
MGNSRRYLMTFFIITTAAILFICFGCANTNRTAFFTKPVVAPEVVTYRPWTPNRSVCVLPFENLSKDTDADIKVREIFVTELFRAHIFKDIVDIVEANAALMSLRIRKPNSMDNETIKAIGERLGVEYLILGVLTEYGYGKGNESGAEVGLSVRMIEVENGNILWTANNFKMGTNSLSRILGISQGPSPMELTRKVVEEIVSALSYEITLQQRKRERAQKSGGGIMGIFGTSEKKGEKSDYRR